MLNQVVVNDERYKLEKGIGSFHDCRVKCALGPNCEHLLDDDLNAPCGGEDMYLVKWKDSENAKS
ncbi:hypothetical protein D0812_22000 [Vibrio owensii]|uniref:Uncharacterized protein n=1 Tax=Vibrio owensii TaxID=696485 RepID=A0ABM6ZMY8_9VIBR|nr:hypothetical protein [Vibrio owensii]AYO17064.1 hypothetical protein D0812_22000 [Vibrio owensii]